MNRKNHHENIKIPNSLAPNNSLSSKWIAKFDCFKLKNSHMTRDTINNNNKNPDARLQEKVTKKKSGENNKLYKGLLQMNKKKRSQSKMGASLMAQW